MKAWIVLAAALLCAAPAQAQFFPGLAPQVSKIAVSGKPVLLYRYYSANPDCTHAGYAEVRITQQPQSGSVTVKKAMLFPAYPPSNVRHVCNTRRVQGVEVYYTSRKGFVGTDQAAIEGIFPQGNSISSRFSITVK